MRAINLLIAALAFALTEIGREMYRLYAYSHNLNDFGIADTIGNHIGTMSGQSPQDVL